MRLPAELTKKRWAIVDEDGKVLDIFKHYNSAEELRRTYQKAYVFKLKVVRVNEDGKVL